MNEKSSFASQSKDSPRIIGIANKKQEEKMRKAFILLKPNDLSQPDWIEYIYKRIKDLGLKIVSNFKVVLHRAEIYQLWSTAPSIKNNLDELETFLGGKTLNVYILEGENIFYKLWLLKKELRLSFPNDHIRNLIHVPDNEKAYEKELIILQTARVN